MASVDIATRFFQRISQNPKSPSGTCHFRFWVKISLTESVSRLTKVKFHDNYMYMASLVMNIWPLTSSRKTLVGWLVGLGLTAL